MNSSKLFTIFVFFCSSFALQIKILKLLKIVKNLLILTMFSIIIALGDESRSDFFFVTKMFRSLRKWLNFWEGKFFFPENSKAILENAMKNSKNSYNEKNKKILKNFTIKYLISIFRFMGSFLKKKKLQVLHFFLFILILCSEVFS